MISPYVRRLRLAAELKAARVDAGLTHKQLAKMIGQSRAQISRLENGHVVDLADIIKILDVVGVDGERWTQIVTIAREAAERGWWESTKGMGERQALYANLEAGAATIREFQMTFVPGLLQTPEYTAARVEAEGHSGATAFAADEVIAARAGRQRMLRRPNGPSYDVILDEMAVRRAAAPSEVVRAQLYHVAARVNGDPRTTVRVLPLDAEIEGFSVPRSAFSLYTYPDPGDPTVVAVDTVTDDIVLTDGADVKRYEELYDRLRDAAMSVSETLRFLVEMATVRTPFE
jgi:transcriptional regulator with XRE-family HTH domain